MFEKVLYTFYAYAVALSFLSQKEACLILHVGLEQNLTEGMSFGYFKMLANSIRFLMLAVYVYAKMYERLYIKARMSYFRTVTC